MKNLHCSCLVLVEKMNSHGLFCSHYSLAELSGSSVLSCLAIVDCLLLYYRSFRFNQVSKPSPTHTCLIEIWYIHTVLPALRANSCIAIDRLVIELLDFHIPFLSFTNAGFKGYGKNLLNRRLRITLLP